MANTNITVNANVNPAMAALDRLTKKFDEFNQKNERTFTKMNTALVALSGSLLAIGTAAAMFADDITDVAQANDMATASVLGLQSAMSALGGRGDNVGQMLQRLSNSVDGANGGNLEMISNFNKLGISMKDLGSLSNTEINDKLLSALSKIEDPVKRNALAMQFFGKALVGVDLKRFAEEQKKMREEMQKYSPAIEDAADAWDNVQKIMKQVKLAFLEAFNPLFQLIKAIKIDTDVLAAGFKLLGTALLIMTGAAVLKGMTTLVGLFSAFAVAVRANPLLSIASALLAVGQLAWDFKKKLDGVQEKNKEIDETTGQQKRDQEGINELIKKRTDAIRDQADIFAQQNKNLIDMLSLEAGLIGLSKEDADIKKSMADLDRRAGEEIDKLIKARERLTAGEKALGLVDIYNEQIKAIEETRDADIELMTQRINSRNAAERLENVRLFGIQTEIDKLKEITKIQDEMSKLGLSDIESKYYDIEAAAKASGLAAIQAEEKRLNRKLDPAEQKAYYDEAIKGTDKLLAAQQQLYDKSRLFGTGWSKALNEFSDNAMNAADKAYRIFQKMTSGMEDLIVDFAKTGKWEWRNFVNSIVEELLRSQIRTLMAQIFNLNRGVNTGSTGGLLGGAIIPGFLAKGGPATANKPYIVGEKGPELFVPGTSGTVVPNNALGGGTSVTYNINAVDAMSFKQMIAADPSFIYAVTQQGAKSVPSTRR